MSARTVVIDWPEGEGIEIRARDNEPYLAGTDFLVREVRGHALPEKRETIAWLRESYGDLTAAQLVAAVDYYFANEYVFMVDDDWP